MSSEEADIHGRNKVIDDSEIDPIEQLIGQTGCLSKNDAITSGMETLVGMTLCVITASVLGGKRMISTTRRIWAVFKTGPTKLTLVVRDDLRMSKGKIASQCCHATLIAYKKLQKNNYALLQAWEDVGQPKVVLKVSSIEQLMEIYEKAKSMTVNTAVVYDAGRTQVEEGTATCVAVGPAPDSSIDIITGHLKLL